MDPDGNRRLKVIAAELITQARKSVTIDWTLREGARGLGIRRFAPGVWVDTEVAPPVIHSRLGIPTFVASCDSSFFAERHRDKPEILRGVR